MTQLADRISCQEQLLPGTTLQEKWDFAQRAGFAAIELRGKLAALHESYAARFNSEG